MAPSGRSALLFAAKFAVLFTALIIPWRWLGEAYSLTFSLVSTVACETVVDEREFKVRFEPTEDSETGPGSAWGVRFLGTNARTGTTTTVPIEAREIGYVPMATLVALVYASALERRRRRAILAGGLLALGARVALAVALPIAHFVGTLESGSALDTMARVAFRALIEPPDMMYAAPVVVFLLGLFITSPGRPEEPAAATAPPPQATC